MKAVCQEAGMRRQTVYEETCERATSAGFRDSGPEASVMTLGGREALALSEQGNLRGRNDVR
jgi:hypothetical protein